MENVLNTKRIALACLGFALSGCMTAPSTGGPSGGPETKVVGDAGVTVAQNSGTGAVNFLVNGVSQNDLYNAPLADHGVMSGFADSGGGSTYAITAQTANSIVVAGAQRLGSNAFTGGVYGRLTPTIVPTTGTATFAGDYGGFWREATATGAPTGVIMNRIRGDAHLTADFQNATIMGTISHRSLFGARNNNRNMVLIPEDLNLLATSISANGSFAGAISGGGFTYPGFSATPTGGYEGMISGATGGEVVGGVTLMHPSTSSNYYEVGVFLATQ